jgi:hypothetical protein
MLILLRDGQLSSSPGALVWVAHRPGVSQLSTGPLGDRVTVTGCCFTCLLSLANQPVQCPMGVAGEPIGLHRASLRSRRGVAAMSFPLHSIGQTEGHPRYKTAK